MAAFAVVALGSLGVSDALRRATDAFTERLDTLVPFKRGPLTLLGAQTRDGSLYNSSQSDGSSYCTQQNYEQLRASVIHRNKACAQKNVRQYAFRYRHINSALRQRQMLSPTDTGTER